MSRKRMFRVMCGHDGCAEYGHFEVMDRAHGITLDQRYGAKKWRCVRHSQPDEMLSLTNMTRMVEVVSREEPHGRYFGNWGFVSGPGFKVFARDFPPGTKLRVTAEIILPEGELT